MKILVPIKLSLDTSQIKFDESTGEPIYEAIPKKISDADKCAIEEALEIKDKYQGAVTVVTIGSTKDHYRMLRDAYAMGVDETYLIKYDSPEYIPANQVANIIKSFFEKHGPYDVILMGQWSNDTHSSSLQGMLSSLLNYPLMPNVDKLDFDGTFFIGSSNMEDGTYTFKAKPPLIISVSTEANLPRIPTLKDILRAKKMPINELNISDYIESIGKLDIVKVSRYVVERLRNIIKIESEDDVAKAIDMIVNVLKGEGLI